MVQLCHLSLLRAESEPAPLPATSRAAHLIEVPLPITGTVDTQIKRKVDLLLSQQTTSETRPILILEFAGRTNKRVSVVNSNDVFHWRVIWRAIG